MDQAKFINNKYLRERGSQGRYREMILVRARAISDTRTDPMPNISELLADPA